MEQRSKEIAAMGVTVDHRFWITLYRLEHPELVKLSYLLPVLSVPVRKDMMTVIRVQQSPSRNPSLLHHIRNSIDLWFSAPDPADRSTYTFRTDILPILDRHLSSPVFCGLISLMLRVTKYQDEQSAREEITKGITKELDAAMGEEKPKLLNYRPFFDTSYFSLYEAVHPGLPPRPVLNAQIRTVLHRWKVYIPFLVLE